MPDSKTSAPQFRFMFAGIGYGCVLFWLGVFAAGAGHGTHVLLGLSSSPLPLLAGILGILGAPLLWGAMGFALARRGHAWGRRLFLGAITGHYVGLWPVLTGEHFGDWSHFKRVWLVMPGVLLTAAAVYLSGQVALWALFIREGRLRLPNRGFQFSIRRLLFAIMLIAVALVCLQTSYELVQLIGVAAAASAVVAIADGRSRDSA